MSLGWFRCWRGRRQAAEPDERRRALVRAIQRLPTECRDVLVLHRFKDMPLDVIAAHLGIDQALAEARLAEALVRLCRAVDEAEARQPSERK